MDLEPQANSTQSVLAEDKWLEIYGPNNVRHSIYYFFEDILAGDSNIKGGNISINQSDSRYCFDLIPGHPKLSFIEDIFSDAWNKCSAGDLGGFRKSNWLNSIGCSSWYKKHWFFASNNINMLQFYYVVKNRSKSTKYAFFCKNLLLLTIITTTSKIIKY